MTILPIGISLTNWANQLRNEYPDQQFPELVNENDWRDWVNLLILVPAFRDKFIPTAMGFSTWDDWAKQFTLSIGG